MRMRRKDKGFTLIEVVIAIAILAIALAPLTANFIASSKMNVKSRKNLNAMNLAQDIMEGMRGYSAEDVRGKLRNASTTSTFLVGNVLPMNTTYNHTGCTVDETGATYKYKIDNITPATGNLNTYDVEIQMTPDTTVYTGEDMASISSIDQYFDATYTMSETPEDTEDVAAAAIFDKTTTSPTVNGTQIDKTLENLKKYLKREIILEIKKTGVDSLTGNTTYATTVEVQYTVTNLSGWGLDASTGVYPTSAVSHNISKAEATVCPNSVYLYYTGLQKGTVAEDDKITIKNTSEEDITVYLIRTQAESDITDANKITYNAGYKCRVDISAQKNTGTLPAPNFVDVDLTDPAAKGKVFLVTNVRFDLSKNADENANKDGDKVGTSGYDKERANIYYNDTTNKVTADFYKNTGTYPVTYIYDGYQKSNEKLLYNVKLVIMDKDDNTKILATYDGGTIN